MRTRTLFLPFVMLLGVTLAASQGTVLRNVVVTTMTVSATVMANIEVVVLKDLEFDLSDYVNQPVVLVNPQADPSAGKMKLFGDPSGLVRLTYEKETILRNDDGTSELRFIYSISGGQNDVPSASTLLELNNQVRLSETGAYYVWVGGRLSGIEHIVPGSYTMELLLEVEYM